MKKVVTILFLILVFCGCKKDDFDPFNPPPPVDPPVERPASLGIVGDTSDVSKVTRPGVVIMGGSTDVDAAFRWMIERSGGGDVVIIRSSGTDAYNSYVFGLGKVNSVETLKINSRRLAEDDGVARIIRNAEMLFIAGGDQSEYVSYWKGTKVAEAINYLVNTKKVPVGGTSAGAAILGNYYFSAEGASVTSASALANPYSTSITLYKDDFLKIPYLENVIVDQHFSQRGREGRTVAFLGRIMKDWSKTPTAIGVDEKTAVCIDESGKAEVLGTNKAYFIQTFSNKKPEVFEANKTVTWDHSGQALHAWSVNGSSSGNRFDMATFQPSGAVAFASTWWSAVSGNMYYINN